MVLSKDLIDSDIKKQLNKTNETLERRGNRQCLQCKEIKSLDKFRNEIAMNGHTYNNDRKLYVCKSCWGKFHYKKPRKLTQKEIDAYNQWR
jgi:hypothetical protein